MRYYRFPDGTVLTEDAFRYISRVVYRYFTGRIGGSEFERLMGARGFPRARAYLMYYWIINRIYRVFGAGREVLFCMSLISTGSDWRRRYLECRVRTTVPEEEVEYIMNYEVDACYAREEAHRMYATEPVFECSDVRDIVDLFKAMATKYFESKGYDYMMLSSSSWYMGFMIPSQTPFPISLLKHTLQKLLLTHPLTPATPELYIKRYVIQLTADPVPQLAEHYPYRIISKSHPVSQVCWPVGYEVEPPACPVYLNIPEDMLHVEVALESIYIRRVNIHRQPVLHIHLLPFPCEW